MYIARIISIDALVEFRKRVVVLANIVFTVVVAVIVIVWAIWCDEEHDVVASWEIVGCFFLVVVLAEESQFV